MTSNSAPYLLVGLGNPGRRYRFDRHNIGFMLLDKLANNLDTRFNKVRADALIANAKIEGRRIYLAKPQTFMNISGRSVAPIARYFRVPISNLLIIFDDLDLPLGYIRLRPKGGSGGHKGMQSILSALGTPDIPRMRLGIGRPTGRKDAAAYVLEAFGDDERLSVESVLETAQSCVISMIGDGIDAAMTRYNSKTDH